MQAQVAQKLFLAERKLESDCCF